MAPRRGLGQVLMAELWAVASGPVLPTPMVVCPPTLQLQACALACAPGSRRPGRTGRDGGPGRPVANVP